MSQKRMLSILIIVAGFLMLAAIAFFFGSHLSREIGIKDNLKKVELDWQSLDYAIASYEVDRCGIYKPPDTTPRKKLYPDTFLTFETDPAFIATQPVGYNHEATPYWEPLTTPVAYLKTLPIDPFNPGHYYGYTCWTLHDRLFELYLLHSPGPDGKADLPLSSLREKLDPYFRKRAQGQEKCIVELTPEEKAMVKKMIIPYLYDPTNGLLSQGDLIKWHDQFGEFGTGTSKWADISATDNDIYNKVLYGFPTTKTWDNQPTDMKEFLSQRVKIKVSSPMIKVLQNAGITLPGKFTPDENIKRAQTFTLYNHLQKNYDAFFLAPGPLNNAQLKALQEWRKASPQWWGALTIDTQKRTHGDTYYVGSIIPVLPVYGKSMLLWAGEELAKGNISKAYLIYRTLSMDLDYIQSSLNTENISPHYTRIMNQLTNMSNDLFIEIARRDSLSKTPIILHPQPSPYAVYMVQSKMLLLNGINSKTDKWGINIEIINDCSSYFTEYIRISKPLGKEEIRVREIWQKEHPLWWNEMQQAPEYWLSLKIDQVPLDRQKALILYERKDSPGFSYDSVLAVAIWPYMASQLILIDDSIAKGDKKSAEIRMKALEVFISRLDDYQRKHGKLINETRQFIDRRRKSIH
jgi:hypothetical protein